MKPVVLIPCGQQVLSQGPENCFLGDSRRQVTCCFPPSRARNLLVPGEQKLMPKTGRMFLPSYTGPFLQGEKSFQFACQGWEGDKKASISSLALIREYESAPGKGRKWDLTLTSRACLS